MAGRSAAIVALARRSAAMDESAPAFIGHRPPRRHDPLPIDDVLRRAPRGPARTAPRAVLVAPPGAGKTTRVPLALLDEPWAAGGGIIMLEPRRLAARAAAERMAATLGETVGETVGLRARFDTRVSARTRIEVVTEGVFTRMILDDPASTASRP